MMQKQGSLLKTTDNGRVKMFGHIKCYNNFLRSFIEGKIAAKRDRGSQDEVS